jgi:hypothetical protein
LIKEKYLGSCPLFDWIRKPTLFKSWASPYWKGMIASSPVILHWLQWKPGTGSNIRIGRDLIMGLGVHSLLSPEICEQLEDRGFSSLAHIKAPSNAISIIDDWIDSGSLSLFGLQAWEWNSFTSALKRSGITLSENPDCLVWAGGDSSGSITVKNLYSALLNQLSFEIDSSWVRQIWNWKIPLKIKLFTWLAGREKILTWEALRRRGREGPGICILCKRASEDVNHLLVHCDFTREVWNIIFSLSHFRWTGPDPLSQHASLPGLPKNPLHQAWQLTLAGRSGQRETKRYSKIIPPQFWRLFTGCGSLFPGSIPVWVLFLPWCARSL